MATALLRGILPAVVTPFRDDELIDYGAWQSLIERLIASGVHGLFVLGGQGEFYALNEEERMVATRFCVQTAARRVPVIANVGAVTTGESVRLAQQAEQDGVDLIAAITPYFIRPSEDELVEHYSEICRSVRLPVIAYNIPQRTGVELNPPLVRRIAEANPNFAGLKDSGGRLEWIPEFKRAGVAVLMGQDRLILDGLRMGCAGAITACANLIPRLFVDILNAFQAGNIGEAARLQALVEPLDQAFSLATFPALIKEAMNMAGLPAGRCRRPVGPMSGAALSQLAGVLDKLREAGYLEMRPLSYRMNQ